MPDLEKVDVLTLFIGAGAGRLSRPDRGVAARHVSLAKGGAENVVNPGMNKSRR
ncbi:hypothetical protein ACI6Q5_12380 [Xanthomonas codiaei]|uniref:Uncharacterized protein n=1 Tax=Xanthomonas codiaei TaxID=56463 RepID=A0ABW9MNE6_9XANT